MEFPRVRHGRMARYAGAGVMMVVATLSMIAMPVWASGTTKIGSLLTHPDNYRMKLVRVTGVVANHQLEHIKRWATGTDRCMQIFTVQDETGSIQAAYRVSCAGAMDLLRNRDRVTLEGRFEWSSGKSGRLNVESVIGKVAPYP